MLRKDRQAVGREHIVSVGGNVLGYNSIDINSAHQGFDLWDGVDAVIRAYTKINPSEVALVLADNKLQRQQAASSTGSNKSGTMRSTISLPFGLMLKLDELEPTLLTDKRTLYEFMRRYEGFRTCRVI